MPFANQVTSVPVTVDAGKCIADKGCTACIDSCPLDVLAIDVEKGVAYMRYNECWYCTPCQADCPTGAVDVAIPIFVAVIPVALFDETSDDFDALIERLITPDAAAQRVALAAASDSGDQTLVPTVIALLRDQILGVREDAARALGAFSALASVPALLGALQDREDNVRAAAATTLADLNLPASAPLLIAELGHADPFVRSTCLHSLTPLRSQAALPSALAALRDEAVSVRRAAAALLGWLRDEVAQSGLITATADEDAEVRRVAIGALLPGGLETQAAFTRAFDDENWQVREEAATRAGRLKLEATLPALIARMQDDYWQVRVKAAASLGQLKLPEAIPALAEALAVPISNLRKEATAALGEIGHRDALPHLAAHADDPDPDVRKLNRWAAAKIQAG